MKLPLLTPHVQEAIKSDYFLNASDFIHTWAPLPEFVKPHALLSQTYVSVHHPHCNPSHFLICTPECDPALLKSFYVFRSWGRWFSRVKGWREENWLKSTQGAFLLCTISTITALPPSWLGYVRGFEGELERSLVHCEVVSLPLPAHLPFSSTPQNLLALKMKSKLPRAQEALQKQGPGNPSLPPALHICYLTIQTLSLSTFVVPAFFSVWNALSFLANSTSPSSLNSNISS